MQKATSPKRFYIDHTNDKVEVRAVSCPWPQKRETSEHEFRQQPTQTERLLSAGRLVRGGFFRKR